MSVIQALVLHWNIERRREVRNDRFWPKADLHFRGLLAI